jgi:peptide/nickel transport system substrate-binding protein
VERDASLKVENLFDLGYIGVIGLNNLYPPFDNIKLRQSMLYLVSQEDMLLPTFADSQWFNARASWFTCGSDMENDANTGWFKGGQNLPRARELMKEGGYDGRPVIILQAADVPYLNNAALVLAQQMGAVGYNAQTVTMDVATMEQRRASMAPPDKGGSNIFFVGAGGMSLSNPYMSKGKATNGRDGWFGWPTDARNEELRAQWLAADTREQRRKIAWQIQDNIWNVVPKLFFGQWRQPVAYRRTTSGWLHVPEIIPFWNVAKA